MDPLLPACKAQAKPRAHAKAQANQGPRANLNA